MLVIMTFNLQWWVRFTYVALSGFPFAFAVFSIIWCLQLFPMEMYTPGSVSLMHLLFLTISIDFIQSCAHRSVHTFWKGTLLGRSHMIHHIHRNPNPEDAFFTGFVDATIQLILPVFASLHIVRPSKYTAIAFGCMYSWWLLFIHSSPHIKYPRLEKLRIVTPRYHHMHHQNPTIHFSNIIQMG